MSFSNLIKAILRKIVLLGFAIIVVVICGNYFFHLKNKLFIAAQEILKSSKNNVYQVLPSLILEEEYGSVADQLNIYKEKESLTNIEIIDHLPDVDCLGQDMHFSCHDYFNKTVQTYFKFNVNEKTFYLYKSKLVSVSILDKNFLGLIFFLTLLISSGIGFFVIQAFVLLNRDIKIQLNYLSDLTHGRSPKKPTSGIKEVIKLSSMIEKMMTSIKETEQKATVFEISRQLAHDIRSPLSALRMITGMPLPYNDKKVSLIKEATKRIMTISDDLLKKSKPQIESVDLILEITSLAREKEVSSVQPLTILLEKNLTTNQIYISPTLSGRIIRIISNLINNSIEASCSSRKCKLTLGLQNSGSNITLLISDNGLGIPKHNIPDLFKGKLVAGKKHSNGIGLKSAKDYLTSVDGDIKLLKSGPSGTCFEMFFPKTHVFSQLNKT